MYLKERPVTDNIRVELLNKDFKSGNTLEGPGTLLYDRKESNGRIDKKTLKVPRARYKSLQLNKEQR
jgi:hypothetical protein